MRAVENTHLSKQNDCNAAALSLADLRAKPGEEGFDVSPLDICACRVSENQP